MALDLFEIPRLITLAVVLVGILLVGVVLAIRATIRQHHYLAKWDFLHAVKDAEKHEYLQQRQEQRIRNLKDQTQRGDAS